MPQKQPPANTATSVARATPVARTGARSSPAGLGRTTATYGGSTNEACHITPTTAMPSTVAASGIAVFGGNCPSRPLGPAAGILMHGCQFRLAAPACVVVHVRHYRGWQMLWRYFI